MKNDIIDCIEYFDYIQLLTLFNKHLESNSNLAQIMEKLITDTFISTLSTEEIMSEDNSEGSFNRFLEVRSIIDKHHRRYIETEIKTIAAFQIYVQSLYLNNLVSYKDYQKIVDSKTTKENKTGPIEIYLSNVTKFYSYKSTKQRTLLLLEF